MDIQDVQRNNEERLMRLPNVTGIGIGEKDGKPVIKLFVTMRPRSQQDIFPKTLDGFEVVVEETGPFQAQKK